MRPVHVDQSYLRPKDAGLEIQGRSVSSSRGDQLDV